MQLSHEPYYDAVGSCLHYDAITSDKWVEVYLRFRNLTHFGFFSSRTCVYGKRIALCHIATKVVLMFFVFFVKM